MKGKPYGAAAVIDTALQNSPQILLSNGVAKEVYPFGHPLVYFC